MEITGWKGYEIECLLVMQRGKFVFKEKIQWKRCVKEELIPTNQLHSLMTHKQ